MTFFLTTKSANVNIQLKIFFEKFKQNYFTLRKSILEIDYEKNDSNIAAGLLKLSKKLAYFKTAFYSFANTYFQLFKYYLSTRQTILLKDCQQFEQIFSDIAEFVFCYRKNLKKIIDTIQVK